MPAAPGLRPLLRILGRRRPRTRGTLRLAGPRRQIVINRDRWGIPHVDAASDADAWFALGFCHGQDRAFQLEILARAGRGTLSALLGPAALPVDRLSRTLGVRRVAERQLDLVDDDVRSTLAAYAAGVSAAARVTPRPVELVLLRARVSAWHPADILAFQGLQSLALAGNWDTELARLRILLDDGPEAVRAATPAPAAWLPATAPVGALAGPGLDRLGADLSLLRDLVGGAAGSNAWAVAGSRTASGAPILANDPHLAPAVPAPWYLVHLRTPEWEVAGASFVGGPVVPSGHNGHLAWGVTAGCTDAADLFWEELDADAGTCRGPSGPEPVERRREVIEVRGDDPVELDVLTTPRGPIVTPVLDGLPMALSLSATWLHPAPVRGLIDVQRARDAEGFRAGLWAWPGPALNVVHAGVDGHVGWQLIGTLPRRRRGAGLLPLPAWEPDAGWEADPLPFAEMPHLLDPDAGFVVSANNAPRPDGPGLPHLGSDWLDGYRAARLVEALGERGGWTVAATCGLQTDVASVPWREVRDLVLERSRPSPDAAVRRGRELLDEWDGAVRADSAGAAVFELLMAELAERFALYAAPVAWRSVIGAGVGGAVPRTILGATTASRVIGWLRDHHDARSVIDAALSSAVERARAVGGNDPTDWAWGRLRPLTLRHVLGARRPLDRALNLGPMPLGGDANTVAQAGVRPLEPLLDPGAIPNHRMVVDLGDVEASRFVLAGGQSGSPTSPHYADMLDLWRRGEGVPIAWSRRAVAAATVDTLVLRPA